MSNIQVKEILPQADRMMLLDKVIEFDNKSMITELRVRNDGLFGDETGVPAWVGIEYMAQTVAAHTGMMNKLSGKPVTMGLLLGTRHYSTNIDKFVAGIQLRVKVERLIQDQGLSVFACRISGENIEISAKLNVYEPEYRSIK